MTKQQYDYDIVIIGGGASGILAAISARRQGASVLLLEKMPRLGKKILASGAGRCNLLNDSINASFYNPEAKELVESVFAQFGKREILGFFKELGLVVYSDKGKIFPVTNQAASVIEVLEMELSRLGVDVRCHCQVSNISASHNGFVLTLTPDKRLRVRILILCAGGKSYPALGSDGQAYKLASGLGHNIIEPVPSAVSVLIKDTWCHILQGQKISVALTSLIDAKAGRKVEGELLFTKYGLSGTAILDVSEEISIAINRLRMKNVSVVVDLLPFINEEELQKELSFRLRKKFPQEKLLIGLVPHKFSFALLDILKTRDAAAIAKYVKNKKFSVNGTRGWNEAEFTAGGLDTREVNLQTLESKFQRGLYFAGEILNVQGRRGGYNLAWAWASGYVAGLAASNAPILNSSKLSIKV